MKKYLTMGAWGLGIALAVLVIEKKTGIFGKIFAKIPGVNNLLA